MSLSVRFLGTSAARPTVERGVSSLAIIREGETLLFDCGEGTQRQMMRYGISFALSDIFFTHFHGDHLIGIVGLFRTLALQGRVEPFRLWGPRGAARVLRAAAHFGVDRIGFPVEITELEPGNSVARNGYSIAAIPVDHRGATALAYVLTEEERRGRFNPELARSLGIPEGQLWGRIHHGHPVTLDDGRVIAPETLVGPTRPGRRVALSGDTRPNEQLGEAARGADLLVHEATFGDEEAARAAETGHSTARQAAELA
ncbi:MAG TPA: ribonuclease Z, partial [Gemmatimonadaceae bacterium]|nr:ribonuclease Z [Gemmatimonadaceae bacterium]